MQCGLWRSQCYSWKIAYSTPTQEKGKFRIYSSCRTCISFFVFFFLFLSDEQSLCATSSPISLTFLFPGLFFEAFLFPNFHGRAFLGFPFPHPKNKETSNKNVKTNPWIGRASFSSRLTICEWNQCIDLTICCFFFLLLVFQSSLFNFSSRRYFNVPLVYTPTAVI